MESKRKRRLGQNYIVLCSVVFLLLHCKQKNNSISDTKDLKNITEVIPQDVYEFGFNLNHYTVKRDTIKKGESFGEILERHQIAYPKIYTIAEKAKDTFDIRRLQVGKPYTLLCTKDSLQEPKCFIYQPNKQDYVVINFKDSIHAYTDTKPVKYVEKELSGVITSNISATLEEQGSNIMVAYMLSDIYAWTIDFFRLQKNDRFKVIYTEKYIDDSIYAGIENIKAAYFEHNKEPFYAFEFTTDSVKGTKDYYSDKAQSLRRAFLKAPVKFKRISSRYNLKRRIRLYGNRIRPHRGTDFAAAIGTPIMATANGRVTKSSYTRGNGNYVKIKHNSTYSTQYLHMKKRKVRVGQYVKQGDVIGWVGMTGNTSGPHVCYRFWKNGKQVDPFKQKLPQAEPISNHLKSKFLTYIEPLKKQLDYVPFPDVEEVQSNEILESENDQGITTKVN